MSESLGFLVKEKAEAESAAKSLFATEVEAATIASYFGKMLKEFPFKVQKGGSGIYLYSDGGKALQDTQKLALEDAFELVAVEAYVIRCTVLGVQEGCPQELGEALKKNHMQQFDKLLREQVGVPVSLPRVKTKLLLTSKEPVLADMAEQVIDKCCARLIFSAKRSARSIVRCRPPSCGRRRRRNML